MRIPAPGDALLWRADGTTRPPAAGAAGVLLGLLESEYRRPFGGFRAGGRPRCHGAAPRALVSGLGG
jgi:hypothetical protein